MLSDSIKYLNRKNFKLYCAKCYQNPDDPGFDTFEHDMYLISQTKRLITDYYRKHMVRDLLTINYIKTLENLFGKEPTVTILFYKVEPECYYILRTFFDYRGTMPEIVRGLKKPILASELGWDRDLRERLKRLENVV